MNRFPEGAEFHCRITVRDPITGDAVPAEVTEGEPFTARWYVRPPSRWYRILRRVPPWSKRQLD